MKVDVIVVSFNSRDRLRACVEPLLGVPGIRVVVVDNASSDGSLESVAALPVTAIAERQNGGFARACNVGWRRGEGDYVLFLNPDATIASESIRMLADVLDGDPAVGIVGPKIVGPDGELHHSQRRFERLTSVVSEAVFLHRILPGAAWTDGIVRDPQQYEQSTSPEWLSGACLLTRRSLLETLDGFDQRFFLYCEDMDLCRRTRAGGFDIRFVPSATAIHEGGASAARGVTLPILLESRLSYGRIHFGPVRRLLHRAALGAGAFSHVLVSRGGASVRRGHARSLARALGVPLEIPRPV
jgi:GT2 family glycosyltransferase